MTAVLRYTLLRITLFVVALVGLALAGATELTALIGAAVVSMLASYVLLRGPREAAARALAERTQARLASREASVPGAAPRSGLQDDAAAEDARLDADGRS